MESAGKFIGLGAGKGGAAWCYDDILAVAQYSPQIALAKAMRVPFAPFLLPIACTFADSTTLISNMQTFQSNANTGTSSLAEPTIVDGIIFEIDAPNANAGNALKSVNDFFYGLNSGIMATMMVDGAPKYAVAPFFVPLRALCSFINEGWPAGWVLQPNQSIVMQFQQVVAVPSTPTTVTCTFRMWQPVDTSGFFVQMGTADAFTKLVAMGIDVTAIQGAPVNR
jgi:hypothetical protein